MLIVLEGPDHAGKSTYANQLTTGEHKFVRWHKGPIIASPYVEYMEPLIRYTHQRQNIVCDRWHIGELIYGPILRGSSKLEFDMAEKLDSFITSIGGIKVYIDTALSTIVSRGHRQPDDLVNENYLPAVHAFYRQYMRRHIDWFASSAYNVEDIVRMAKAHDYTNRNRLRSNGV